MDGTVWDKPGSVGKVPERAAAQGPEVGTAWRPMWGGWWDVWWGRGQEGGRQAAASLVKSPCGQERSLGLPPGGRGGREASERKPVRSALGCKASLLGRGYVVLAGGRGGSRGQLGQWRWRGDK